MLNDSASRCLPFVALFAAAAIVCATVTRAQSPQQPPAGATAKRAGQVPGTTAPPAGAPAAQAARPAPAPVPGGRGGPAPAPRKHLLVLGMTRGFHHGSTSDGLAMFWNLGKESGAWDTEIRTDMEWVTKKNN